ncbi:MAG: hypothetical protein O2807_11870 [bacterium]|nr:hypothetical protein [bacterium]
MIAPQDYFRRVSAFPHAGLFEGLGAVWEAIGRLEGYLREAIAAAQAPEASAAELKGLRVEAGMLVSEGLFTAQKAVRIPGADVLIEAGVRIEPGALVKGPTILCGGAELRHGAYLRGSCLIGPRAVVGHATEVKNSVFLEHAEAGHFAYVGDSLLGEEANLGAGVKLANLEFRTGEEKKKTAPARNISLQVDDKMVDTGLRKFGAVVGDFAEVGCNAVTSPGTLLGPGCWVLPNLNVPKGIYPGGHLLRAAGDGVLSTPRKR